ncbi:MAG: putative membrane protein [Methanobacterium sp. Maddingley MBC34]|nr:MAG: putative membrane protein [Methanobacterium sp. Maddingley MBC34]
MSAVDNITDLSKYMVTLPPSRISILCMTFLSFLTGAIAAYFEPLSSLFDSIVYGGSAGFLIFGLTSIMDGAITQPLVNAMEGRHMKMKQSMFVSLLTMVLVALVYIVGSLVSTYTVYSYVIDALILGCALAFGLRIFIIWGTSNIGAVRSILISAIQPLLILSMVVVIVFLTSITTNIGSFSIIAVALKGLVAGLILMIAIYSFMLVIESPIKRNLGVGGLELLSLFIAQYTEGSRAMESLFEDMGEPIDTLVGVVSFKSEKGVKGLFISPCVHPGPVGTIGGGNMPTVLAKSLEPFTMVSHGPSTHDFNPVSSEEICKIKDVVLGALDNMEYSPKASQFIRVEHENAKLGAQYFGDNLLLLATFAPLGFDDIDFGVGLAIIKAAQGHTRAENVVLVDCHNSFKGESGRVLPGNPEVFQLIDAVEKLEKPGESELKMGCANDTIPELSKKSGVGQSGVKVMVLDVNDQKTAYILMDANNMVIGFRDEIVDEVKKLGLEHAEVMTTDTHFVNGLSGGHNPLGIRDRDIIMEKIVQCTKNALEDIESVQVGAKTVKLSSINTLGPTHATELVTTISSIVAVSRIMAPLVFVLALIFVFIWIFYWAF